MKLHKSLFNQAFAEVRTTQRITDLTLKMQAIKKIPQDRLTALFFEMCDWGINLYIQAEREKNVGKSKREIIREHYQRILKKR
jgi:hypothetical protein